MLFCVKAIKHIGLELRAIGYFFVGSVLAGCGGSVVVENYFRFITFM